MLGFGYKQYPIQVNNGIAMLTIRPQRGAKLKPCLAWQDQDDSESNYYDDEESADDSSSSDKEPDPPSPRRELARLQKAGLLPLHKKKSKNPKIQIPSQILTKESSTATKETPKSRLDTPKKSQTKPKKKPTEEKYLKRWDLPNMNDAYKTFIDHGTTVNTQGYPLHPNGNTIFVQRPGICEATNFGKTAFTKRSQVPLERFGEVVENNPKAGAFKLKIGKPSQDNGTTFETVTNIQPSFQNSDRLAYYQKRKLIGLDLVPGKNGSGVGDEFINDMFSWAA
ncbi:hypothetical protein MJO29_016662 [Puccinia striiformis f. sp. tritici]|nr:hypothetical protein MJO29_016662 [Puccinia striiformis f. sp. tritici]